VAAVAAAPKLSVEFSVARAARRHST